MKEKLVTEIKEAFQKTREDNHKFLFQEELAQVLFTTINNNKFGVIPHTEVYFRAYQEHENRWLEIAKATVRTECFECTGPFTMWITEVKSAKFIHGHGV